MHYVYHKSIHCVVGFTCTQLASPFSRWLHFSLDSQRNIGSCWLCDFFLEQGECWTEKRAYTDFETHFINPIPLLGRIKTPWNKPSYLPRCLPIPGDCVKMMFNWHMYRPCQTPVYNGYNADGWICCCFGCYGCFRLLRNPKRSVFLILDCNIIPHANI